MTTIQIKVKIYGRVQGVFYRQSTLEVASKLGLSGYVRNMRDGTVEAIFEGSSKTTLNKMLDWCRIGPSFAQVDDVVIVHEIENKKEFDSFTIERTL